MIRLSFFVELNILKVRFILYQHQCAFIQMALEDLADTKVQVGVVVCELQNYNAIVNLIILQQIVNI